MNKKIFLLIIAAVLFLVPLAKVSAIQTYVGVKITATTPTNSAGNASDSGKLWCLPVGTYLQVASGSPFGSGLAPIGPSANPVYTTTPTCPGSTIWSGLLNLTNGSLYTIRIDAGGGNYYSYCSGTNNSSYGCMESWDTPGENQNCSAVCAHYGQTVGSNWNGLANGYCVDAVALKGSPCTTCNLSPSGFNYYDKSGNCWYYTNESPTGTWSDPNYIRVCRCNINNTGTNQLFDFPFTPTGL